MQSLAGTSLALNTEAKDRHLTAQVLVAWDGINYIDETGNLESLDWDMRYAPPGESVLEPGFGYSAEATLNFHNYNARYEVFNTSSPINAHITAGRYFLRPVIVKVGLYNGATPERLTIFRGHLSQIVEPLKAGVATFTCRDRSAAIIQRKATTVLYTGLTTDQWLTILATAAGLSAADCAFDKGLQIIPYAWLDDESIWEQMARAVAAEGGYLYFDGNGKLRFENGAHFATAAHQTSVYTFTRSLWVDAAPEHHTADVYNEIVVEYASRVSGPLQAVYELEKPIVIAPGQTHHLKARLSYPASSILSPRRESDDVTDYVAHLMNGDRSDSSLTVLPATEQKYAQRYEADLKNTNANMAIVVSKFQVRGYPLLGEPSGEVKETRDSNVAYTRTREMRGNTYIQHKSQAASLAEFLADRYKDPRLVLSLTGVPGIPYLELGDRVTVNDSTLFSTARDCFIVGLKGRLSLQDGFSMDFTLADAAAMTARTSYFALGTSKYGIGAGSGFLWYGGPSESAWTDLATLIDTDILSAGYLNTLAANANYVHGMVQQPVSSIRMANNTDYYLGYIWHKHNYLRWTLGGAGRIYVNGTQVATSGGALQGVTNLAAMTFTPPLVVGEMYTVTATGMLLEVCEQPDTAQLPTAPTVTEIADAAVSSAATFSGAATSIRDALEWARVRLWSPAIPRLRCLAEAANAGVRAHQGYFCLRHRFSPMTNARRFWFGMSSGQRVFTVDYTVTKYGGAVLIDFDETGYKLASGYAAGEDYYHYWQDKTRETLDALTAAQHDLLYITYGVSHSIWETSDRFGLDYSVEDPLGTALAGWEDIPVWGATASAAPYKASQPIAADVNKLVRDVNRLTAATICRNYPTPDLATANPETVSIRHRWRFIRYKARQLEDKDGKPQWSDVKVSWGSGKSANEATLLKSESGAWVTDDLSKLTWLVEGAVYSIIGAAAVLEIPE